jgi:hypothetical protein
MGTTTKDKTEGIAVTLSKEKSEEYLHSAFCNGSQELRHYDLELDYEDADYKKAKKSLEEKIEKGIVPIGMTVFGKEKPTICFEDVLMEILRIGGKLTVTDIGNEGEYTKSITLADVHKRVQKTPFRHLNDMINESDDAITADVILQTVFFEDIIFG